MYRGMKLKEQSDHKFHPDMPKDILGHYLPKLNYIIEQVIFTRLILCNYNKTITAASLGVSPRTLRQWVSNFKKRGVLIKSVIVFLALFSVKANCSSEAWCTQDDCKTKGWTEIGNGQEDDVTCTQSDCWNVGFSTRSSFGATSTTSCRVPSCFVSGWDNTYSNGPSISAYCLDGDCMTNGWTLMMPGNQAIQVHCIAGDCEHNGQWLQTPQGQIIISRCKENDCYVKGWLTTP